MDKLSTIRAAIKADVPLLLEGHTGTGKTYTIMRLAEEMGKTLHVINVSGELTVDSILGQQSLIDGSVTWHDGTLTVAMKSGDWVLFDEMNTALPEVLTVINGVLDDSRSITLPNRENERVKAHDDFRFIGTQNPSSSDYAGTGRLNNALLNRMVRVEFGYMQPTEEIDALKAHTKLKDGTLTALVSIAGYTRDENNNFSKHVSTRDLVKMLRLRDKGGMTIEQAVSMVLIDKYEHEEYRRLYQMFDRRMMDLELVLGCKKGEDPFETIMKQQRDLKEEREQLEERGRNLKEEIRKELLRELISNVAGGTGTVPEGF